MPQSDTEKLTRVIKDLNTTTEKLVRTMEAINRNLVYAFENIGEEKKRAFKDYINRTTDNEGTETTCLE